MQEQQASEPRKLHRAAIAVWLLDAGKIFQAMVLPFIILSTGDGGERAGDRDLPAWFSWGIAAFASFVFLQAIVGPFVKYVRFRYYFAGNALVIHGGGLVNRWRRVIPLERIQSVDAVQKLRHKVFGVVELNLEVIGGKQTEGGLAALTPEEADRVRGVILKGHAPAEVHSEEEPLVKLPPRTLMLAGLTGGRVAVAGLLIAQLMELAGDRVGGVFEQQVAEQGARGAILRFVILGVLIVLISFAFSLVATLFAYWDFTVRRQGDRLSITRGLLSTRQALIPLRRVQALTIQQNPLRRLLGLASISVVVAGYSNASQERLAPITSMLLPLAKVDEAFRVAREVIGVPIEVAATELEGAPRRAVTYRAIDAVLLAVAAAWLTQIWWSSWWGAFTVVPFALIAFGSYRALGYRKTDGFLITRSGFFVRSTTLAPIPNIQQVQVKSSLLQRLLRLSTVTAFVPKGSAKAINLDRSKAADSFVSLAQALETP